MHESQNPSRLYSNTAFRSLASEIFWSGGHLEFFGNCLVR
jgi:hypothetical protein